MIKNKARFSKAELALLFGSDNMINTDEIQEVTGISTDSREIDTGNLFVALAGEKFDGHDKISEAVAEGAVAVVISRNWYSVNLPEGIPMILADNTLDALGILASYHRKRFNIPVIAIAGSNGKTTTKEMTAHLLTSKYKVLHTHANFNNRIGAPLVLLQLDNSYEAAVIEIGTNEPGEISILSDITAPTHGLITNIGEEHLEKLIDLTGVEMEETALFAYLQKHGGFSFINADDLRLIRYEAILDKKFRYGTGDKSDIKAGISFSDDLKPTLTYSINDKNTNINMQTKGISTSINAVAAVSIAIALGMSMEEIKVSLENFSQSESGKYGRMKYEAIGNIHILNDTYNSNPSSAMLALDTLKLYKSNGKKIAVLADMLELGEATDEAHLRVVRKSLENSDIVLLFGPKMEKAFQQINEKDLLHFKDKIKLSDYLSGIIESDDILLVKGSRGMRMEDIVINIKEFIG